MTGMWKVIVSVALAAVVVVAQEDLSCGGDGEPSCPAYAGYETSTNVTERGEIDLDVRDMAEAADGGDFAKAKAIFENGENSEASEGMRTLAGFSQAAEEKMGDSGSGLDEKNYKLFRDYYGSGQYCYDYVKAALDGSGEFSGAPTLTRAEASVKGAQYQCTLMYVIHEMEDAVADCNAGDATDNDGGAKAWDEAVAFYVGSLVGSGQAATTTGELQYGLAEDRFAQFTSAEDINEAVMNNFQTGKGHVESSDCGSLQNVMNAQIDLFKVPVLQGLIRYAYLADENGPGTEGITEEVLGKVRGEGNAFARALLPWIDATDSNVASFINDNFPPTGQAVKDGYSAVVDRIDTLYGKGEFSTVAKSQVGAFTEAEDEAGSGGLSGGAIAGIVIGVVVGLALLVIIIILFMRRNKNKAVAQKEASLHSNGVQQSADYIPPQGP